MKNKPLTYFCSLGDEIWVAPLISVPQIVVLEPQISALILFYHFLFSLLIEKAPSACTGTEGVWLLSITGYLLLALC